jgi:hypothetical protein
MFRLLYHSLSESASRIYPFERIRQIGSFSLLPTWRWKNPVFDKDIKCIIIYNYVYILYIYIINILVMFYTTLSYILLQFLSSIIILIFQQHVCTIFVLNLPQTTQLQQALIAKNYTTLNWIPTHWRTIHCMQRHLFLYIFWPEDGQHRPKLVAIKT